MGPSRADETRPLILLVEDDPALGRALRFALEVEGYSANLLDCAEALLDPPFPEGPVCIVADLNLPGLSGLEALETLRRRGVRAPAILTTTQPTKSMRAKARDAAAMVVEKPILGDRLTAAIRDCWQAGGPGAA